jgi:hypothetical protein
MRFQKRYGAPPCQRRRIRIILAAMVAVKTVASIIKMRFN